MKVEFKSKEYEALQNEGISQELIEKIITSGKLSPAMFTEYCPEPVNLVRCNDHFYWVMLPDNKYLKDEKKQNRKIPVKECVIAHAKYWLAISPNAVEELEQTVQTEKNAIRQKLIDAEIVKEVKVIKDMLEAKVRELKTVWSNIKMYILPENELNFLDAILLKSQKENRPVDYEKYSTQALRFINIFPDFQQTVEMADKMLAEGKYDEIFMSFETKGLPLLLEIKYDDPEQMELLKQFFSKEMVEATAKKLSEQSHIESVAMFRVNQRFVLPKNH